MKYLIVNADDFGAGRGINRGIVEAHQRGIVRSTSMLVDLSGSAEAASLLKELPGLDVGLHVRLTEEDGTPRLDFADAKACAGAMEQQCARFRDLVGRAPTHLDSHQNVHRDSRLTPVFVDFARRNGLPLREHSPVRYFSEFYGQWDGETHPEQITVEHLLAMLDRVMLQQFTELSCHPGYVSDDFPTSYAIERELELKTLCDPRLFDGLRQRDLRIIDFPEYRRIVAAQLPGGVAR